MTVIATVEDSAFRGCPFINAANEFPDPRSAVRELVTQHSDWYTDTLAGLLAEIGHPLAGDAADEIMLARDGAMTGGYAGDPVAATTAFQRAVERIIREAQNRQSGL